MPTANLAAVGSNQEAIVAGFVRRAAVSGSPTKAVMLSRLANGFAEAGQFERAAELISESLQTVRSGADDQGLTSSLLREIVVGETRSDFNAFPLRSEVHKGALARLVEAGHADAAAEVISQLRAVALDPERGELDSALVLARAADL